MKNGCSGWLLLLALLFQTPSLIAQDGTPFAVVMFYNLENLYDTEDDSLKQDDEFLPQGERRWSRFRFYTKLTRISKVITNTGYWEPPAIIGLCEVENRQVLEKLVAFGPLRSWNFSIIHKDSPDERGIDVAAIYRPSVFTPVSYRYFPPVLPGEPIPFTREILCVTGILSDSDTLHLFFNHWPSRYSGLMETRALRNKAADRLRYEIGKIWERHPRAKIIIMGDFNDQPEDESLCNHLEAGKKTTGHSGHLFNLSYHWMKEGKGTLKHGSQWNVFDQVIITENLLDRDSRLFCLPEDARILDAPFLLEPDDNYTGSKLNRTYQGFTYHGGYSDHLPVMLMLRNKEGKGTGAKEENVRSETDK